LIPFKSDEISDIPSGPSFPLFERQISWRACESEKAQFLGEAAALLFPVDWPEPFGLAIIEVMASGTPAIAFRRGSVPEVVKNGTSGFIVDTLRRSGPNSSATLPPSGWRLIISLFIGNLFLPVRSSCARSV
jgi:glycosyltransferase involved in cell wall biosynthesis